MNSDDPKSEREEFEQRIQRLESDFEKLCDAIMPHLKAMDTLRAQLRLVGAAAPPSENLEAALVARLEAFQQDVVERLETYRLDLDLQRSLSEGLNIEFRKDVEALRAEFQRRIAQDEQNQKDLLDAQRQLLGGQAARDLDVQEDIRILQRQILQIRQGQDAGVLQALRGRLGPEDADEDPEEFPGAVSPDALSDAAARLDAVLRRGPSPVLEAKLLVEIERLQSLASDLELEARLQERASEILKLLMPRLLQQAPAEQLQRRARRYVFVDLPDVLEDLAELGHRELSPDQLGPLQHALEGILVDVGLEEIRPARGETVEAAEHSLLRVEPGPEPGLEGRVASCLRAGLRVRATGEVVRKAEVSVYP